MWLGDVSYTLYLVHWPTIVTAKYLMLLDTHVQGDPLPSRMFHTTSRRECSFAVFACFAIMLLITLAVHYGFERPLLRSGTA